MVVTRGVHEAAVASKQTGSFGSWSSPITADAVVAGALSLLEPRVDGDDIYWIEARPLEKGRNVVVIRAPDGTVRDITPPAFNARTQVYSYGGGAYAGENNLAYLCNFRH